MSHSKKNLYLLATCLFAAALLVTCHSVDDYCPASGQWYDPTCQFCFAGSRVVEFCPNTGKQTYNPLTQGCDASGNIGMMCADESISASGTPCGGFTLSVGTAPAGGGTVTGNHLDKASFNHGDPITMVAVPADGYRFAGWAGSKSASGESLSDTMYANKSFIAMFRSGSAAELTVSAFPKDGGKVSIDGGTPEEEAYSAEYGNGDDVTVKATPASGYTFKGWSGATMSAPTSQETTVTMDGGTTLVAIFEPAVYTLTVNALPAEGGAVFINGSALEAGRQQNGAGAQITALARPAEGYTFTHWSGASGSTDEFVTIDVAGGNLTLTANFQKSSAATQPTTYTLTASANPAEGGTVSPSAPQSNIPAGTEVGISATASSGYAFKNWTVAGGGYGTVGDAGKAVTTVKVGSDVTVIAHFEREGGGPPPPPEDTTTYNFDPVKIGDLTWTKNLNIETADSWCYNDTASYCAKYGRLYTWEAANSACAGMGGGWRLPDRNDWNVLMEAVGGTSMDQSSSNYVYYDAGKKLKSTSGWYNNGNGTDDYGFSALPGGARGSDGSFDLVGFNGIWWSASAPGSDHASYRHMNYYDDRVNEVYSGKSRGVSVRCVQGNTVTPPTETYTLTIGVSPSSSAGTVTGAGTYGAGTAVTITATPSGGYTFANWTGPSGTTFGNAGSANTIVTVNSNLVITANFQQQVTGDSFIDPRDNQTYPIVTIGSQRWMGKNLNYAIPTDGTDSSSWCYENEPANCNTYGRLYNWSAATNACPSGWKLPDRAEWTTLVNFVGSGSDVAGKKLKSTSGWYSNGNGTDDYGFSALPGGNRYAGGFGNVGYFGYWWSATARGSGNAYNRYMGYDNDLVNENYSDESNGFSVRCVGVVEN